MPVEHWIRVKQFFFFLIEAKITSYYMRSTHSLPKSKSRELTRVINFCSTRSYLLSRSVSGRINYRTNINEFSRIARNSLPRHMTRKGRGRVSASIWRGWSGVSGRRSDERKGEGEREQERKKARSWLNFTAALCYPYVYTCPRVCAAIRGTRVYLQSAADTYGATFDVTVL